MNAPDRKLIAAAIGAVVVAVATFIVWWMWGCPPLWRLGVAPVAVIGFTVLMVILYWFTSAQEVHDGHPMPQSQQRFLAMYLVSTSFVLVYVIFMLLAVRFADPPPAPAEPSAELVKASLPTDGRPVVLQVIPATLPVDAGPIDLQILGYNLVSAAEAPPADEPKAGEPTTKPGATPAPPAGTAKPPDPKKPAATPPPAPADPTVVIGGVARKPKLATQRILLVSLETSDTAPSGQSSKAISVVRSDGRSAQARIGVLEQAADFHVFHWKRSITRETQLFLLVVFAGALGSYIHAIRSLTAFIGNQQAVASWFWFYVTRPFVGVALAIVFYATIRGGFVAGSPADVKAVNPFGVFAIAALVGMFADKAGNKLADIFDALFKSTDATKRNNPMSNLEITTASLKNATQNAAYTGETIAAKGGTPPVSFGLRTPVPPLLQWLTIDAKTGALGGTPTAVGTDKVTVTATDGATTVTSKTFDLTIV